MKDELTSLFNSMTDGDNTVFSVGIAQKTSQFVNGGAVLTTDKGTIPTGDFTGTGTGNITTQATIAQPIIQAACEAMNTMTIGGDDYLAQEIATAIDTMCTQKDIITTTIIGNVTLPNGTVQPISDTGKGDFTSNKTIIENAIKQAITQMLQEKQQGDDLQEGNRQFAEALENGVKSYITSGTVTTKGENKLVGDIGAGAITV